MSISDFLYYLPELLVVLAVLAAAVWGFFFLRSIRRDKQGKSTCPACKGIAEKDARYNEPYLFALPLSIGDMYESAERYLPSHMIPILDKTQIPLGKRACWVTVYRCTQCEGRHAVVVDFLQVRGEEHVKGRNDMDLELLRPLLEQVETQNRRV